jgi:hypothetical protein
MTPDRFREWNAQMTKRDFAASGKVLKVGLLLFVLTLLWRPALAMEFQRSGKVIHGIAGTSEAIQASGVIEHGDAQKFLAFVRVNGATPTDNWTVELSSPGGNLIEGIALGQAFRNAGMVTSVRRGHACMSACAIAFLGGVYVGASGGGIGRQLEFGASLGFHGFKVDDEGVAVINETLSTSRVLTGLILAYAVEMKGVDIGWLSEVLTVAPERIYLVKRPRDIEALDINLMDMPPTVPADWFLNVCRKAVAPLAPTLSSDRVTDYSEVIPTIKKLRQLIVAAASDSIASRLGPLSDRDAVDMVVPGMGAIKPILDARVVRVERGGGFEIDECIAIRGEGIVLTALVDLVNHRIVSHDFGVLQRRLALFDDKGELW